MSRLLTTLQTRFDRHAIHQLRAEVAKLATKMEELEAEKNHWHDRAIDAEQWADQWRNDFMELQLNDYPNQQPGITKDGHLVRINPDAE